MAKPPDGSLEARREQLHSDVNNELQSLEIAAQSLADFPEALNSTVEIAESSAGPIPSSAASGIPCTLPDSDVAGVFMSPCASIQSSPIGSPFVFFAHSAAAATDYTDIWYIEAEAGWGGNVVQSDTFLFITFCTTFSSMLVSLRPQAA